MEKLNCLRCENHAKFDFICTINHPNYINKHTADLTVCFVESKASQAHNRMLELTQNLSDAINQYLLEKKEVLAIIQSVKENSGDNIATLINGGVVRRVYIGSREVKLTADLYDVNTYYYVINAKGYCIITSIDYELIQYSNVNHKKNN
jgi:hypothetical protein